MLIKTPPQRPVVPVIVMASASVVVGFAAFLGIAGHDPLSPLSAESLNAGGSIARVDGLEHVPSWTVRDWAAVADVVVVAEATAEESHPTPRGGLEPGVDFDLVGRRVTVRPISTVWVSSTNARELPEAVDLTQAGWVVDPTDPEAPARKLAFGYGSRIEVGHTYVLGLTWLDAWCGDDAEWAVFGSGAALPLDEGVLGLGEIRGRVVEDLDALDLIPGTTVLDEFAGQSASALGDAIEAVQDTVARIPLRDGEPRC
jgi:hypothetical protein